MPANTVYVGRPSRFGNPYFISDHNQHLTWFRADLRKERESAAPTEGHRWALHFWRMSRALHELRGKNLACWCPLDRPCHAEILLELANGDRW